jgi:hypothetical protein
VAAGKRLAASGEGFSPASCMVEINKILPLPFLIGRRKSPGLGTWMRTKRGTHTLRPFNVSVGSHVCRRTGKINGGIGITENGTTEGANRERIRLHLNQGILAVIWRLLGWKSGFESGFEMRGISTVGAMVMDKNNSAFERCGLLHGDIRGPAR